MKKFNFATNAEVFSQYDYDDFNKLMFDTAYNKLEGVTKREANEKIKEVFDNLLGLDEKATKKEIRKALRRRKNELFEIIEDFIPELRLGGWGSNPFFNEYVELKSANEGDQNVWTAPDETILAVSTVSGGHHDIIRQRLGMGKTYSVPTKWYAVKVYAEFEQFLAGKIDWTRLVQKIYEAMDLKISAITYAAFSNAGSVIPTAHASMFLKSGTLVENTLLELVENVQLANPGKEIRIMGVKSALARLSALAPTDWAESAKEERHTLGRLGMWEGISLAEIPQVTEPNTLTRVLPGNKLWVVAVNPDNKMIKVYDEGEAMIKEISDGTTNMDMTMEYEYMEKIGVGCVFTKYFGIYEITP